MSDRVYVAAIWSYAHRAWCEFCVSPDEQKVRHVAELLDHHTATVCCIVSVERDDWDVIRPALAALPAPDPTYTPKELEMFMDGRFCFRDDLMSAFERGDMVWRQLDQAEPVDRRPRGVRRIA